MVIKEFESDMDFLRYLNGLAPANGPCGFVRSSGSSRKRVNNGKRS